MIERTTFDLRMAEHTTTTARVNAQGWQQTRGGNNKDGKPVHLPLLSRPRVALAALLVDLATRLAPAGIAA